MNDLSQAKPSHGHAPLSPLRALWVLIALVVILAGYLLLAYALHVAAVFAGSFFLFFWLGVEKATPATFPATLVGALGGIANAALFHAGVASALALDPGLAALGGLVLLLAALYMLLTLKGALLFNQSYMLFLTVAAIPQLATVELFEGMVEGVLLSAIYFGSVFALLRFIGSRRRLNAGAAAMTAIE